MKTLLAVPCIVLAAVLFAVSADLAALLPGDGTPEGWSKTGDLRTFKGPALYSHINGGAEVYHGHGFVVLLVQDYAKDGAEVRVEMYDMGSSDGAKGIFGDNTAGLQTDASYGVASSLDDFQIIFHKDRYYVSVTNYTGGEVEMKAMAELAKAMAEAIP